MCYNAISPPNGCACFRCCCCCSTTNPNSIVRAKRQKGRPGKLAKPKYEQQQQQQKQRRNKQYKKRQAQGAAKAEAAAVSNWKCTTISKGWALGSRRDYVSNKIARARVCVCAPTFTHHQRHSEHLTAKQSRGDGSQFVSCFPSADAAALASTSARSSFV